VNNALSVLRNWTAGLREVGLNASTQERLRASVRAAEAYANHAEFVKKRRTLPTRNSDRGISTAPTSPLRLISRPAELALNRRTIGRVFETVDVLVSPTTAVQPLSISELATDVNTSIEIAQPQHTQHIAIQRLWRACRFRFLRFQPGRSPDRFANCRPLRRGSGRFEARPRVRASHRCHTPATGNELG